MEIESLDEAIEHIQRAIDLAKEQKDSYGDDITTQLRIAKKKRWKIQEPKRIQKEVELQTYLTRLVVEDRDRKIGELVGEDVDVMVCIQFSFKSCVSVHILWKLENHNPKQVLLLFR